MQTRMAIKILSTDFDGTLHTESECPPVPQELQELIAGLQAQGVTWVINTGRELASLTRTLGGAHLSILPDYVVTVEREIHCRTNGSYHGLMDWNDRCQMAHDRVFERLRKELGGLVEWVKSRFTATVYEDPFSPFCLIAQNNADADEIQRFMDEYCQSVPDLVYVRNDVYARFSHVDYNKGSALAEIGRRLGVTADEIVAAGDHLNDLPMLSNRYARWLIAPGNAVDAVKESVQRQRGIISHLPYGHGLAMGLRAVIRSVEAEWNGELQGLDTGSLTAS